MSSAFLAYAMVECMVKPDFLAVLITHEEDLAVFLVRRAKRFAERCIKSGVFGIKLKGDSKEYVELNNRSMLFVLTAGSQRDVGRGQPVNLLIASEVAYWPNPTKTLTAILPRYKFATKIYESTANGAGGWFYTQCKKAFAGKSKYTRSFVPWFEHPEYTIPGATIDNITEEEQDLKEDYGITDEQLAWRRETLEEMDNDPENEVQGEDAFKQEFPSYWQEAFLRSGSPVFGARVYRKVQATVKEPNYYGDIDCYESAIVKHHRGPLSVWETPSKRKTYAAGIDPGEGLGQENSTCTIYCRESGEQVAEYVTNSEDPIEFTRNCLVLCKMYNTATVVIEANSITTVVDLFRLNYPKKKIWRTKNLTKVTADRRLTYGWVTNKTNRRHLIYDFKGGIKDGLIKIRSEALFSELQSFIRTKEGRMEHASGEKDDRVFASALCWQSYKDLKPRKVAFKDEIPGRITMGELIKLHRENSKKQNDLIIGNNQFPDEELTYRI